MRKFNKLFILISIILLSFACMGCKSDENLGDFYSLNEGMRLNLLDGVALRDIYKHNIGEKTSVLNDKKTENKIKKRWVLDLEEEGLTNITAQNVIIKKYCGVYNGCYVVTLALDNSAIEDREYLVWIENVNEIDKIKLRYTYDFISEKNAPTIYEVYIDKNLGVYNDAYVLLMSDKYTEYSDTINKETIGDYIFEYTNCSLLVYYKTKFYNIKEAYRGGLLKVEDIEKIYKQFPEPSKDGIEVNGKAIEIIE